jgi:uncharacterized membrane protein
MKIIREKIDNLKRSNLKGLWCYALGWISGIFFLITARDNKYVRFHAIQSTVFFGLMTVVLYASLFFSDLGGILFIFILMISVILWKWLMWQAHNGEMYKLPLIGNLARRLANADSMEKIASPMAARLTK